MVAKAMASFPLCPIPEIARLGRTLKSWRQEILAYFKTEGASNGPTEAISGVIETTRRIVRGFRNFANYRLRNLLSAGDHRPYRNKSALQNPKCSFGLNPPDSSSDLAM
jgi:transposase